MLLRIISRAVPIITGWKRLSRFFDVDHSDARNSDRGRIEKQVELTVCLVRTFGSRLWLPLFHVSRNRTLEASDCYSWVLVLRLATPSVLMHKDDMASRSQQHSESGTNSQVIRASCDIRLTTSNQVSSKKFINCAQTHVQALERTLDDLITSFSRIDAYGGSSGDYSSVREEGMHDLRKPCRSIRDIPP